MASQRSGSFDELYGPSRRNVLRYGAMGMGAVALGSLAACSDKRPSSSQSTTTSSGRSISPSVSGSSGSSAVPGGSQGGLAPFDPNAAGGTAPNLPKRLAYPNPYTSDLFVTISNSMKMACQDRGLDYVTAVNNGDPSTQQSQTDQFFVRGIGALVETPYNPQASDPAMSKAMGQGAFVVGIVRGNCITQSSEGSNYRLGFAQAQAAVEWVKANLGGEAQVAYFNEDSAASLIPRHQGALAALKQGGPGIKVVSDISAPLTVEDGANAMNTILQAHPGVNVVIGGSGPIQGAYAAFKAQGKQNDPHIYLTSIGPSNADFDLITTGGIYRATSGEPWPAWAYSFGQFAADWMEGKSVPRGITVPNGVEPILKSAAEVSVFQKAMSDPRALWQNKEELAKYVAFYGNINYTQRSTVWKDVWDIQ